MTGYDQTQTRVGELGPILGGLLGRHRLRHLVTPIVRIYQTAPRVGLDDPISRVGLHSRALIVARVRDEAR
jgi:hypothetical protein